MEKPICYENELASIKGLAMHRPTHEPWREETGDYPYAWHFRGRKRIWEVRVQMRFKSLPQGPLFFGLEMRYVDMTMSMAAFMTMSTAGRYFCSDSPLLRRW